MMKIEVYRKSFVTRSKRRKTRQVNIVQRTMVKSFVDEHKLFHIYKKHKIFLLFFHPTSVQNNYFSVIYVIESVIKFLSKYVLQVKF